MKKALFVLDTDEVAMLLDYIEHCGDTLTGQKRVFYEKTKERDLAIVTLLLGTGIRVSECVGLDIGRCRFLKNNGNQKSPEKVEMKWLFTLGLR